jgi:phosphohistidine phosphatase
MEIYFLRHGLAGQHGDPKYKDDSLRPLTAQGREKMHQASLGMQSLGLKFDIISSSPYLRARQTAEITAQVYKIKSKKIYLTNKLLPPASIEELLKDILTRFPKSKKFLLVGHEPHLTEMISCLLKSDGPLAIDFKKGALCSLTITHALSRPSAVLNWLLTPAQLGLIAQP